MLWFRVVRRKVKKRSTRKSRAEHAMLGAAARAIVHEHLARANAHYGFTYNKIFIRNTRTRWGSCSTRGNLGFNYRIVKLPPELAHYVVVHELCHRKEFNHSAKFWALVAETIPNWKKTRATLRKVHIS